MKQRGRSLQIAALVLGLEVKESRQRTRFNQKETKKKREKRKREETKQNDLKREKKMMMVMVVIKEEGGNAKWRTHY